MSASTDLKHDKTQLPSGDVESVSPLVRRIIAPNATPFTFTGTCTYIVGRGKVAVIDPGPDDAAHLQTILRSIDGESLEHIVITHTHKDHSPGARALQAITGAKIVGCAAFVPNTDLAERGLDASHDIDHTPDQEMNDGDELQGAGFTLRALATPGHAANHLCFALPEEDTMFSGDHVMAWSTSIVAPPDGNMQDYMRSLDKLLGRSETQYWPGHGNAVREPQTYVQSLAHHRRQREAAILERVTAGDGTIPTMVINIYKGLDPRLHRAAGLSVLAHLQDMAERGIVHSDGPANLSSSYRKNR